MSGPLGDGEAHLAEDRDQLLHGLADRVDAADLGRARRQAHVDALICEARLQLLLFQVELAGLDGRHRAVPVAVQCLGLVLCGPPDRGRPGLS